MGRNNLSLDFVLGQRIILSNNHPCKDICDELSAPNKREYQPGEKQGVYPKDFLFEGWHPQCFCFVVPILVDEKEIEKMNDALANGEQYEPKGEQITEYPKEFRDFCTNNADKIRDALRRGTAPYFVRNNAEIIEEIINPKNDNNGDVPSILSPTINSANDDDEKKRIEGNRLLYEKLKSDPDYKDVAFNPENGGVMAIHKNHNKSEREGKRYFSNEHSLGYTGKELERLCQHVLFENGLTCILEAEGVKGIDGKELPSLDTTTNGKKMDIRSITKTDKNTIFNGIKAKAKQIKNVYNKTGYRGDSVIIYLHDDSIDNYNDVIHAFKKYKDKGGNTIKKIYCVIGCENKVVLIE